MGLLLLLFVGVVVVAAVVVVVVVVVVLVVVSVVVVVACWSFLYKLDGKQGRHQCTASYRCLASRFLVFSRGQCCKNFSHGMQAVCAPSVQFSMWSSSGQLEGIALKTLSGRDYSSILIW